MFWLNLLCLLFYFCLSLLVFFCLYYFGILPTYVPIRYKQNLLDFILDAIKVYVTDFKSRTPDDFQETGIIIYEGPQGSGKTISMCYDALMIKNRYPKSILIDNLGLKNHDLSFNHPSQLCELNNGKFGICTLIDECGILFNNRDYKHFQDTGMLQIIFENRKVRRCLMGTTQKFMLIDKNLRIQTKEIRSAFTLGSVTGYIRKVPQCDAEGNVVRYKFRGIKVFVQSHELRDAYDTYLVIRKFNDEGYKDATKKNS